MRPLPTQQVGSGQVPDQERRMLPQETRSDSIRILSRMDMSNLYQVQERIKFLQDQLDSLEHYLPETYQLLMEEMDCQQRQLMQIKIQDFYNTQGNEQQYQNLDPRDPDQTQKSDYKRT
jgi:hypothetical protein